MFSRIIFFNLFFLKLSLIASAGISGIAYEISMDEPQKHYFYVKISIDDPAGNYLDLKMPVWAPGSYLVREFARNVENFRSEGMNGNFLKSMKINKNTWRIYPGGAKRIIIRYRVYAFELSVRTSYLDKNHGYINGTSVFMYCDASRYLPATLEIHSAPSFKKISTALTLDTLQNLYIARDYDQLVDCPIEIGNQQIISFMVDGNLHEIAMYGKGNYMGRESEIKKDISKIVQAYNKIFGENPNHYYLFIIHNIDHGGGALEHENSTTFEVNRQTYAPESGYIDFLSLVAHEYLHLWNVKRIKPASFIPYDYDHEMYTDLLWMFEGFTSYYDDVILARLGFRTSEEYINRLTGAINAIESTPGNYVQPVALASFDAWIKYYRKDENSINSSVSYYTKGNVLAAMLDLKIIHQSGGQYSLDDVLKTLYDKYYKRANKGIDGDILKAVLEKYSGSRLDDFFNKYIHGTEPVDYQKYLEYAGYATVDHNEFIEHPFLGAGLTDENGKLMVSTVIHGTSAQEAGISPGDELIAIDHNRIDSGNIFKAIDAHQSGDTIRVTIAREGIMDSREVILQPDSRKHFKIYTSEDISDDQRLIRRKWLGDVQ